MEKKNISTDAAAALAMQNIVIGDFFDKRSKNIFNILTDVLSDKAVTTAGVLTTLTGYSCTNYIPVIAGHYYSISNRTELLSVRCMAANNGSGTPMKVLSKLGNTYATNFYLPNDAGTAAVINGIIKIPEGANYLQVGLKNPTAGTNNLMLEYIGSNVPFGWTPSAYEVYSEEFYRLKSMASPEKVDLKVLLIGSSHGMNTIGQFPMLAHNCGINVICGNAYAGSLTLQQIADYCTAGTDFSGWYKKYYNANWHESQVSFTITEMINDEEWDFISIQRSAGEDMTWTAEQAMALDTILAHITANCNYSPKIVFNSGFADSYSIATRAAQQADTTSIMTTALQVKTDYGIDVIPVAAALQAVRNNDTLAGLGTYADKMLSCDNQHLDQGIGMYVTGCICFNFFLKHLGKSVLTCKYLPTVIDMTSFWYDLAKFTAIEEQYAKKIRQIVCQYFANN